MKRIIRLTESDLARIVRRVIREGEEVDATVKWNNTIGANRPELKVVEGEAQWDFNKSPVEGEYNLVTPYNGNSK